MIIKILYENEKIIRIGDENMNYIPKVGEDIKQVEVDENNPPAWFGKSKLYLKYDLANEEPILKETNEVKTDLLKFYQGKVLGLLKDVNIAIATQEFTNKILKDDSETEIHTISKQDIKTIGKYQNKVATFHQTWNPDDYTIEEINEGMFNGGLILPDILTRLL